MLNKNKTILVSYVRIDIIKNTIVSFVLFFAAKNIDKLHKKIEKTPNDWVTGEKKGVEAKDGKIDTSKNIIELCMENNLDNEK